jgi:uncharacterized protein YjbI with pentapeptide repeats
MSQEIISETFQDTKFPNIPLCRVAMDKASYVNCSAMNGFSFIACNQNKVTFEGCRSKKISFVEGSGFNVHLKQNEFDVVQVQDSGMVLLRVHGSDRRTEAIKVHGSTLEDSQFYHEKGFMFEILNSSIIRDSVFKDLRFELCKFEIFAFQGAWIGVRFNRGLFSNVTLRKGTNFQDVILHGIKFNECDFKDADLSDTTFKNCTCDKDTEWPNGEIPEGVRLEQ